MVAIEKYLIDKGYVRFKLVEDGLIETTNNDYLSSMGSVSFYYVDGSSDAYQLITGGNNVTGATFNELGIINIGLRGHGGIGVISPRPRIAYFRADNERLIFQDIATEDEIDFLIDNIGFDSVFDFFNKSNLFVIKEYKHKASNLNEMIDGWIDDKCRLENLNPIVVNK